MIEIAGELIMNLVCDKCAHGYVVKVWLEESDNQMITVPLPVGWIRDYDKMREEGERWIALCPNCYKA